MSPRTFTIAQNGTTSAAVNLEGHSVVRIDFPGMTGTVVSLLEKDADGNYTAVYDDTGTAISYTTAATARVYHLNPGKTIGMGLVELFSNGTEASARTITVYTQPYIP